MANDNDNGLGNAIWRVAGIGAVGAAGYYGWKYLPKISSFFSSHASNLLEENFITKTTLGMARLADIEQGSNYAARFIKGRYIDPLDTVSGDVTKYSMRPQSLRRFDDIIAPSSYINHTKAIETAGLEPNTARILTGNISYQSGEAISQRLLAVDLTKKILQHNIPVSVFDAEWMPKEITGLNRQYTWMMSVSHDVGANANINTVFIKPQAGSAIEKALSAVASGNMLGNNTAQKVASLLGRHVESSGGEYKSAAELAGKILSTGVDANSAFRSLMQITPDRNLLDEVQGNKRLLAGRGSKDIPTLLSENIINESIFTGLKHQKAEDVLKARYLDIDIVSDFYRSRFPLQDMSLRKQAAEMPRVFDVNRFEGTRGLRAMFSSKEVEAYYTNLGLGDKYNALKNVAHLSNIDVAKDAGMLQMMLSNDITPNDYTKILSDVINKTMAAEHAHPYASQTIYDKTGNILVHRGAEFKLEQQKPGIYKLYTQQVGSSAFAPVGNVSHNSPVMMQLVRSAGMYSEHNPQLAIADYAERNLARLFTSPYHTRHNLLAQSVLNAETPITAAANEMISPLMNALWSSKDMGNLRQVINNMLPEETLRSLGITEASHIGNIQESFMRYIMEPVYNSLFVENGQRVQYGSFVSSHTIKSGNRDIKLNPFRSRIAPVYTYDDVSRMHFTLERGGAFEQVSLYDAIFSGKVDERDLLRLARSHGRHDPMRNLFRMLRRVAKRGSANIGGSERLIIGPESNLSPVVDYMNANYDKFNARGGISIMTDGPDRFLVPHVDLYSGGNPVDAYSRAIQKRINDLSQAITETNLDGADASVRDLHARFKDGISTAISRASKVGNIVSDSRNKSLVNILAYNKGNASIVDGSIRSVVVPQSLSKYVHDSAVEFVTPASSGFGVPIMRTLSKKDHPFDRQRPIDVALVHNVVDDKFLDMREHSYLRKYTVPLGDTGSYLLTPESVTQAMLDKYNDEITATMRKISAVPADADDYAKRVQQYQRELQMRINRISNTSSHLGRHILNPYDRQILAEAAATVSFNNVSTFDANRMQQIHQETARYFASQGIAVTHAHKLDKYKRMYIGLTPRSLTPGGHVAHRPYQLQRLVNIFDHRKANWRNIATAYAEVPGVSNVDDIAGILHMEARPGSLNVADRRVSMPYRAKMVNANVLIPLDPKSYKSVFGTRPNEWVVESGGQIMYSNKFEQEIGNITTSETPSHILGNRGGHIGVMTKGAMLGESGYGAELLRKFGADLIAGESYDVLASAAGHGMEQQLVFAIHETALNQFNQLAEKEALRANQILIDRAKNFKPHLPSHADLKSMLIKYKNTQYIESLQRRITREMATGQQYASAHKLDLDEQTVRSLLTNDPSVTKSYLKNGIIDAADYSYYVGKYHRIRKLNERLGVAKSGSIPKWEYNKLDKEVAGVSNELRAAAYDIYRQQTIDMITPHKNKLEQLKNSPALAKYREFMAQNGVAIDVRTMVDDYGIERPFLVSTVQRTGPQATPAQVKAATDGKNLSLMNPNDSYLFTKDEIDPITGVKRKVVDNIATGNKDAMLSRPEMETMYNYLMKELGIDNPLIVDHNGHRFMRITTPFGIAAINDMSEVGLKDYAYVQDGNKYRVMKSTIEGMKSHGIQAIKHDYQDIVNIGLSLGSDEMRSLFMNEIVKNNAGKAMLAEQYRSAIAGPIQGVQFHNAHPMTEDGFFDAVKGLREGTQAIMDSTKQGIMPVHLLHELDPHRVLEQAGLPITRGQNISIDISKHGASYEYVYNDAHKKTLNFNTVELTPWHFFETDNGLQMSRSTKKQIKMLNALANGATGKALGAHVFDYIESLGEEFVGKEGIFQTAYSKFRLGDPNVFAKYTAKGETGLVGFWKMGNTMTEGQVQYLEQILGKEEAATIGAIIHPSALVDEELGVNLLNNARFVGEGNLGGITTVGLISKDPKYTVGDTFTKIFIPNDALASTSEMNIAKNGVYLSGLETMVRQADTDKDQLSIVLAALRDDDAEGAVGTVLGLDERNYKFATSDMTRTHIKGLMDAHERRMGLLKQTLDAVTIKHDSEMVTYYGRGNQEFIGKFVDTANAQFDAYGERFLESMLGKQRAQMNIGNLGNLRFNLTYNILHPFSQVNTNKDMTKVIGGLRIFNEMAAMGEMQEGFIEGFKKSDEMTNMLLNLFSDTERANFKENLLNVMGMVQESLSGKEGSMFNSKTAYEQMGYLIDSIKEMDFTYNTLIPAEFDIARASNFMNVIGAIGGGGPEDINPLGAQLQNIAGGKLYLNAAEKQAALNMETVGKAAAVVGMVSMPLAVLQAFGQFAGGTTYHPDTRAAQTYSPPDDAYYRTVISAEAVDDGTFNSDEFEKALANSNQRGSTSASVHVKDDRRRIEEVIDQSLQDKLKGW